MTETIFSQKGSIDAPTQDTMITAFDLFESKQKQTLQKKNQRILIAAINRIRTTANLEQEQIACFVERNGFSELELESLVLQSVGESLDIAFIKSCDDFVLSESVKGYIFSEMRWVEIQGFTVDLSKKWNIKFLLNFVKANDFPFPSESFYWELLETSNVDEFLNKLRISLINHIGTPLTNLKKFKLKFRSALRKTSKSQCKALASCYSQSPQVLLKSLPPELILNSIRSPDLLSSIIEMLLDPNATADIAILFRAAQGDDDAWEINLDRLFNKFLEHLKIRERFELACQELANMGLFTKSRKRDPSVFKNFPL